MDPFAVILLLPWALACILAIPGLVEVKNTLDPRSWEVNLLVLSFGWLVFLSYRFHNMVVNELCLDFRLLCNHFASVRLFRARPIAGKTFSFIVIFVEFLVVVASAAQVVDGIINPMRGNVEVNANIVRTTICALLGSWFFLQLHVPHDWAVFRFTIAKVAVVLAPWYVWGLEWVLVKVPPVMVKIWLGMRL